MLVDNLNAIFFSVFLDVTLLNLLNCLIFLEAFD